MAGWIGVITDVGAALLAQWVNEKMLTFSSANAGTGTVAADKLRQQTALAAAKQEASIVAREAVEGGIRLKLQVTAAETGYRLQQYGVLAKIDDGEPGLVALFQRDDEGIPIPSIEESPDFIFTFYALISCSNTGSWEAVLDTSALVSQADLEQRAAQAEKKASDRMDGIDQAIAELREDTNDLAEQIRTDIGGQISALTARVTANEGKISVLWDAVFTDVTKNPFAIVLTSLDGVTVTAGNYNEALDCLEC